MTTPDIHRLLLHPLHSTGIEYMVTGAVAAIAYGEPRMTNDVDVVVRLARGDGRVLAAVYPAAEYAQCRGRRHHRNSVLVRRLAHGRGCCSAVGDVVIFPSEYAVVTQFGDS